MKPRPYRQLMGEERGEGEILAIVLIFVIIMGIGFIIFALGDSSVNRSCQTAYGKNWHSVTKGQFYCEDNNGSLKDTP